jgi:two-component system response regulator AtoC
MNRPSLALSAEAETKLLTMPLRGNVRELKNILERAAALCDGMRITAQDLVPLDVDEADLAASAKSPTLRESVESTERQAILQALILSEWSIGRAAGSLNISRKNLWEKMKRYGIEKEVHGSSILLKSPRH